MENKNTFVLLTLIFFFINTVIFAQNCPKVTSFTIDSSVCGEIIIKEIKTDGEIKMVRIEIFETSTENAIPGTPLQGEGFKVFNTSYKISSSDLKGKESGFIGIRNIDTQDCKNISVSLRVPFQISTLEANIKSSGDTLDCDTPAQRLNLYIIKSLPKDNMIEKSWTLPDGSKSVLDTILANKGGMYTAQVTNGNCTVNDTIKIVDNRKLQTEIMPKVVCDGAQVILTAISNKRYKPAYVWNTISQNTSETINLKVNAKDRIKVTATYKSCIDSFQLNILKPGTLPKVNSFLLSDKIDSTLKFSIQDTLGLKVLHEVIWKQKDAINIKRSGYTSSNSGLTASFKPELASPNISGAIKYILTPVARVDTTVCKADSSNILIKVIPNEPALFIPEIFTPDGDGNNDKWRISSLMNLSEYNIQIFNRYGGLVYSGSIPEGGEVWDGVGYPDGVYYYSIENKKDAGASIKGAVTMIRKRQ